MNTRLLRPIHIFSDFDGTISQRDLGDKLFVDFGDFDGCYPRLVSGEWTVTEYWRAVCASLSPDVTLGSIRTWALEHPADPYFPAFVAFCRECAIPLTVVSDGFDAYIKPVLEREGAGDIPVFCNHLSIRDTQHKSTATPVFWGANESCQCMCGSCKRNALLQSAAPEALIVYIGDGYSGFCAAEHADIIFAKQALAAYCNRNRIPHYPYSTFGDILTIMRGILQKKRIKPRHQALLRRKQAFEIE